jgi:hypothetical protein
VTTSVIAVAAMRRTIRLPTFKRPFSGYHTIR